VLSLCKLPSVKVEACHITFLHLWPKQWFYAPVDRPSLFAAYDDPNVNLGRVMSSADTLVVMTVMLRCARFLADTARLPY